MFLNSIPVATNSNSSIYFIWESGDFLSIFAIISALFLMSSAFVIKMIINENKKGK